MIIYFKNRIHFEIIEIANTLLHLELYNLKNIF